jgi:hypothetical protein
MEIRQIQFMSPIEECDPENDNIDIHVYLKDGSIYSLLVATPNNIFWCMENERKDYFFSYPPAVFVKRLTDENITRAVNALVESTGKDCLTLYGVKQTVDGA